MEAEAGKQQLDKEFRRRISGTFIETMGTACLFMEPSRGAGAPPVGVA
jgi:hypothetical protein